MNSNQNVIIELKNGNKCEGILVNIDKERMVINLKNAKRITLLENGSQNEESFPSLEISKEDIKEVKIVQFEPKEEQPKKEEEKKPTNSSNMNTLNAIPQNLQDKAEIAYNNNKLYNKGDSFFDGLTPMSNLDAKNESIRYNDKNCETFDLPKSAMMDNHSNFSGRRGRGGRGRGNYNKRGGYNNHNNYRQNNYNNYNNHPNNNSYHGGQGNFNNHRGNNNFNRGGSRGGFNNNRNYDQRSFNNYNNNDMQSNFDQRSFNNNQFQKQQQFFGGNNNRNFDNNSNFSGGFNDNISQGYNNQRGGFSSRGRGNSNRGRGNNRNNNNRIPNAEFNAINENNEDQLDDGYVMSIYDKPSISSGGIENMPKKQVGLSAYNPNENETTKSIYDN